MPSLCVNSPVYRASAAGLRAKPYSLGPGPFKRAPLEVYLVKGMSNSYLTSDGVLVDAGASVKDVLRAAGQHGIKVRYLFITHYHVDHLRRAAEIVEALGCRVVAPELDSDVIEGRSPPRGGLAGLLYRLLRVRPARVDVKVRDGDEVEGYRAVAAPGHTPGSTAYVKEGVMFSGDAVLSSRGRPVPPYVAVSTFI